MIVKKSISTYSVAKLKEFFMSEKVVRIFTTELEMVNKFVLRYFIINLFLWIHLFVYMHRFTSIRT